ncbi:MAG: antibiotic biosynthesis monooxygenase [Actinomycetia bacterium]|nr:antibiotic biosynthesis monooxygenase [Actinomycetes bacterium]MCP4222842.1 antibiotic biosynthesis monooxygenase [Actinomycetes bacterium]MCP5031473.1 antibiotic biosynthesis monooxygenase [Actinomycetes bacterium]
MLIIAGTLTIDAGHREAMLEAVAPMVAATLTEPGCRAYAFTPDPTDPGLVRLYELWDSEDALAGHFASAHMAEWQARAATLPITGRDIAKYTISEVGPVR